MDIRTAESCEFDLVSLGEVMLRLDPGEGRVRTTRNFTAWEGGGEYNVARGLRRCFGMRTGVVTAFAENEVGRLVENYILQGGVDTSMIRWVPYDGIGRSVRNGLNFTERGFGVRGALGTSDRGRTAASQMKPGDVDWDRLFGQRGVRWFHTGGIYAALSEDSAALTVEAVRAAKKHGTIVSYDLNFKAVATTLRAVKTATVNSWGAVCWHGGEFFEATHRQDLEIMDRVGGGDSFASGLIYGLITSGDPQLAVEYGAAHGALAMTTPGDTSMATKSEVQKLVQGGSARVVR